MNLRSTRDLLERVREKRISVRRAERLLKLDALSIVDEIARLDLNRYLRRGVPEIVYARGKSLKQLEMIVERLVHETEAQQICAPIIVSKLTQEQMICLKRKFDPEKRRRKKKSSLSGLQFKCFENANIVAFEPDLNQGEQIDGRIALLSAGTSDIGILNETETILQLMGCRTCRFNDVGIASLKRLSLPLREIQKFDPDAIVVAAGMEAALPSLIAGLSSVPVIGLPTSVGYGYGRNGEAALMGMLQACSLGICVVNIDGGVSAGIIAWLIARRCADLRRRSRSSSSNSPNRSRVRLVPDTRKR